MQRRKSKSYGAKKAIWSPNQRLTAVSTYLMLGNMPETSLITGIPLQTLKQWKAHDWFKEYVLQLQSEDVQQLSANAKRIVEKALKALEDRIDLGDAQFDQKTGKITRIPIKAHVALKISTELMARQDKIRDNPMKEELVKTIDDRLLKLAEEFSRFSSKPKAVDMGEVVLVNQT